MKTFLRFFILALIVYSTLAVPLAHSRHRRDSDELLDWGKFFFMAFRVFGWLGGIIVGGCFVGAVCC